MCSLSTGATPGEAGAGNDPNLVVIGLGYVGLALAAEASRSGLAVIGFDVSDAVVNGLNSGRSHIPDVSSDDIAGMLARGFRATAKEEEIGTPSAAVICVPTPLTIDDNPDLAAVVSATETVGRVLRPGALVVLESTTYPGTTTRSYVLSWRRFPVWALASTSRLLSLPKESIRVTWSTGSAIRQRL